MINEKEIKFRDELIAMVSKYLLTTEDEIQRDHVCNPMFFCHDWSGYLSMSLKRLKKIEDYINNDPSICESYEDYKRLIEDCRPKSKKKFFERSKKCEIRYLLSF
jgi:hypothetical protein